MRLFWRLISLLGPFAWEVLLAAGLASGTVLASVGLLGASAWLISTAALHPSIAALQVAIVGVRFFGILRGLLRYLERLVSHSVNFRLVSQLRTWLFGQLERLVPANVQLDSQADLLQRLSRDMDTLDQFYVRSVSPLATAALLTLIMSLWFTRLSPVLGLICAIAMLLGSLTGPGFIFAANRGLGRGVVSSELELQTKVQEVLGGMSEQLLMGGQAEMIKDALRRSEELENQRSSIQRNAAVGYHLSEWVGRMGMLALLVAGIPLVRGGQLDGVLLSVVVIGFMAGYEAIMGLPAMAQYLSESLESACRVFELGDRKPSVTQAARPKMPETGNQLQFHKVSFGYGAAGEVIHGLSQELTAGARIAVTGPNGSGKTTFASLAARFLDPRKGIICLNGQDLRGIDLPSLRKRLVYSPQPACLLSGSIRDNLLLGNPRVEESELARVAEELDLCFPKENVTALDRQTGSQGNALSGGERQRVLTGAALLHPGGVVVLDEPLSHLDYENARRVMRVIERRTRGRTLIVVSHDLGLLDWVDQIIVLRDGRIEEKGSFSELAGGSGWFSAALAEERGRLRDDR